MVDRIYLEELESRISGAVALLQALNITIESVPEIPMGTVQDGIRGVLALLQDADQFKPEASNE